jgi:benzylsuccinate CoA-transferase BbsF subunit
MYPGFGGQGSAIAGFNHLAGWPDREAIGPAGTITDSLSPRYVALLIAAALFHRERTGEGQYIDVSQIETGVYSLSEVIVRASARGEVMTRRGNRAEDAAPHGIYPCAGTDRWIAIAVFSDAEWRCLCEALGASELAGDPRFATLSDRLANEDALDAALAQWTRACEPFALMHRLQAEAVEAGVVQTCADLLEDPQLAHREHFVRLRHRHLGELAFEHYGLRFSDAPRRLEMPGPDLGEHNLRVLGEVGYGEDEIRSLTEAGVLA